jgi:hypothetical protein
MVDDKRPIPKIIDHWMFGATKTMLKRFVLSAFEKQHVEKKIAFNGVYGTWRALLRNRNRIISHHQNTRAVLAKGLFKTGESQR